MALSRYSHTDEESTSISSQSCSMESASSTSLNTTNTPQSSILLLGASSRTGLECIQQLSQHPSKPLIHAFCEEDTPEITGSDATACHSIIEGSVRHAIDIEEALKYTGANWVVICANSTDDYNLIRPKDHSTVAARNLVHVLEQEPFQAIRVLIVSRIEAAPEEANIRIGLRDKFRLTKGRQLLHDLAGQEKNMRPIWDRTTVVRTTRLTDSATGSSRRLVELTDQELVLPRHTTERADLASCIVDEICARPIPTGNRVLNVTSAII
jgi:NAD(P)H-binding